MGNIIHHPGELVSMPGFKAKRDKAGLWTGEQKYHCQERDLARLLPKRGAAHPKFGFLGVDEVEFEIMQDGVVIVSAMYAGASFEDEEEGEPTAEYSLDVTTSEEPIETHPRYSSDEGLSPEDISEAVELARNPPKTDDGKEVAEVDTGEWEELKVELYDVVRSGLESYREPRVTWTMRWVSDERPDDLNTIGEIDDPAGNPPEAGKGRNWLNAGIRSTERGGVFDNERVWDLSGRGGWDERFYS